MSMVSEATKYFHLKMHDSGWSDDVTHRELLDINKRLKELTPLERNEFIRNLSKDDLDGWASEIGSPGWFGSGGLTGSEKKELYNMLAESLDTQSLARVGLSLAQEDEGIAFTEFKSAILEKCPLEKQLEFAERAHALADGNANKNLETLAEDIFENVLKQEQNTPFFNSTVADQKGVVQINSHPLTGLEHDVKSWEDFRDVGSSLKFQPNKILIRQTNTDPNHANIEISYKGKTLTLNDVHDLDLSGTDSGDEFVIDSSVTIDLSLHAKGGNDTVMDRGSGHHRIFGDKGQDDLWGINNGNYDLDGGEGEDVLRGGAGTASMSDSQGSNHYVTGAGQNIIKSDGQNDVINAVQGSTSIVTKSDTTAIYAGANAPSIQSQEGETVLYTQNKVLGFAQTGVGAKTKIIQVESGNPSLGGSIRVEGSEEFRKAVQADLALLRASPYGRKMLAALDAEYAKSGHRITMRALDQTSLKETGISSVENGVTKPENEDWARFLDDGTPGQGADTVIYYNPSIHSFGINGAIQHPISVLYHEMSHALNAVTGTFQNGQDFQHQDFGVFGEPQANLERQAVGLPNGGVLYDFDHDPGTPATTENPFWLSENGLHLEMLEPIREAYGTFSPPK